MKLQGSKEQLATARRQCESCEETQHTLETKVSDLLAQLDASRSQASQLAQEKEMLVKSLDSARAEKNALDKNRLELNAMVKYIIFINLANS